MPIKYEADFYNNIVKGSRFKLISSQVGSQLQEGFKRCHEFSIKDSEELEPVLLKPGRVMKNSWLHGPAMTRDKSMIYPCSRFRCSDVRVGSASVWSATWYAPNQLTSLVTVLSVLHNLKNTACFMELCIVTASFAPRLSNSCQSSTSFMFLSLIGKSHALIQCKVLLSNLLFWPSWTSL